MFASRLIFRNTYCIQGGEDGCDCFLLPGDGEAVMIDAGISTENIRLYAEKLCGMPVPTVINTHSHFDHTGGNGFFDRICITEAASASAKNTIGCADARDYPMDYGFTFIRNGDILTYGNQKLKIVELDCHSQGNIAILDQTRRLLFCGDEVDSGQVLLLPGFGEKPGEIYARGASSVEKFLHVIRLLRSMEDQFDYIMPGHNGAPIDKSYLEMFETLAVRILNGEVGSKDLSSPTYLPSFQHYPSPDMHYRRAAYRMASLVYCTDRIRESDPDHLDYMRALAKEKRLG